VQIALEAVQGKLERFVEARGEGWTWVVMFTDITDVRTTAKYLVQVGLDEDASRLTLVWCDLREWAFVPLMNELLAEIASDEPELRAWLRQVFGEFPSSEELATSTQERMLQRRMAVLRARKLQHQLRQVEAALSPQATPLVPSGALDDKSAFIPVKELLRVDEFPRTYTEVNRVLQQHPEIRRKHPISKTKGLPNQHRTLVHVGDWRQYLAQRRQLHSDPLDLRADMVDEALAVERRMDAERNRRAAT
jgi:hypothetical protein